MLCSQCNYDVLFAVSFDSFDHSSNALSPPPCIVTHAVCLLCHEFKLGRNSTSRRTTVRNARSNHTFSLSILTNCVLYVVFTDDFAYVHTESKSKNWNLYEYFPCLTFIVLFTATTSPIPFARVATFARQCSTRSRFTLPPRRRTRALTSASKRPSTA